MIGARPIDVDTRDRRQEIAQVLPGLKLVSNAAPVAGDGIQIAVGTKPEAAAVVSATRPLKQDGFGAAVSVGRLGAVRPEAREPRATRQGILVIQNIGHENKTVLLEARMNGQAVANLPQVEKEIGLARGRIRMKGVDLPKALYNKEAVRARGADKLERLRKPQPWKRHLGAIGGKRVRATHDL